MDKIIIFIRLKIAYYRNGLSLHQHFKIDHYVWWRICCAATLQKHQEEIRFCNSRQAQPDLQKTIWVPYVCFVNWTRVTVLFLIQNSEISYVAHRLPTATNEQSRSISTGGKLGFFVCSKRAICRFDRSQIFDRYLISVMSEAPRVCTCRKSFETGTYQNTKKRVRSNQPTKVISEYDHRSYCPHQRGFLRNLTRGQFCKRAKGISGASKSRRLPMGWIALVSHFSN